MRGGTGGFKVEREREREGKAFEDERKNIYVTICKFLKYSDTALLDHEPKSANSYKNLCLFIALLIFGLIVKRKRDKTLGGECMAAQKNSRHRLDERYSTSYNI